MTNPPPSRPAELMNLGHLFSGARRAWQRIAVIALAVAAVTAVVLLVRPQQYRGAVVVVPVKGPNAALRLPEAGALLGGSLQLGGRAGAFEATPDVVAYLLRSRTVLLDVAGGRQGDQTLAEAAVGIRPTAASEERLLAALRRRVRAVISTETGFVTVSLSGTDSAVVRALLDGVVQRSQRLFSEVARAQAHELVRAQAERLDSARAGVRRAELALLAFDERNRLAAARTRVALERARLERDLAEATQVLTLASADWQAAVAAELQDAPALAVVEPLPEVLPPWPRRVLLRAMLVGLGVLAAGTLTLAAGRLLMGLPPTSPEDSASLSGARSS